MKMSPEVLIVTLDKLMKRFMREGHSICGGLRFNFASCLWIQYITTANMHRKVIRKKHNMMVIKFKYTSASIL